MTGAAGNQLGAHEALDSWLHLFFDLVPSKEHNDHPNSSLDKLDAFMLSVTSAESLWEEDFSPSIQIPRPAHTTT